MKLILLLAGSVVVFTAQCWGAGAEAIAKQRARELSNQNNVRQGVPPPSVAPRPATSPATTVRPPPPNPSLVRFQSGLAAIQAGAVVTPEQKRQLARDLMGVPSGPGKPAEASVQKLIAALTDAFSEKPLSATSRARLIQDIDAVLNPARYPQAKIPAIFADMQAIFQENGLSRSKAAGIADGFKVIAEEAQKPPGA